ncbi:MAG: response regulator, partial [Desulfovibrionaceae bacterium]|nr:response regulator [Desulfovibrionaceae bacterium]
RRIMSVSAFLTHFEELGIAAIANDITEIRLLQQDLVKAKEQAEQSSRAKSEFLSRMSHEMRTPMNAIIGMASIARQADNLEKKNYCLNKIDDASTHLLGVINDILDMSKIEASKFELSTTDFVFEKMLMRIVNVVNFRVDEKNQNLLINLDPNVPYSVVADEQRLAQVIANLLSNAVKFTPEKGTVTLDVNLLEQEGELLTLKIDVTDTGIGITEEQKERLFEPFEQADGGIARKFGGTGLGLSISRSIVEMMDGEIWAENAEPQGSRFSFTVKMLKGRHLPNELHKNIDWSTVRILAVDDAPEVLEYFQEFADSVGLDCTVAKDGFEACEILKNNQGNPFNVIFTDWRMEGMDGIELTRRIKTDFDAKLVVIMISAARWSDIKDDAEAAGVDKFLAKPLFSSQILDCITEGLSSRHLKNEPDEKAEDETDRFKGYRLLVAEDVDINREILEALLEHTGVEMHFAENGQQAFDLFRQNPRFYDMIFMDIHMPEIDGYEATRLIRKLDLHEAQNIPIVAMTANVFKEDVERCLAAGMDDHVGKPVNIAEVIEKMDRYLRGHL